MGEWRSTTLGDVLELKRGYDLPAKSRKDGPFPIVSSSGISGFHIEPKVKGPGVVTGRYGTIGQVFFIESDFWPLNTTLYVRDFRGNDPRFISYFLRTLDFSAFADKAAVPGVNRNHLHTAPVAIPPLPEQRAIAGVLSALDDKIELNRRTGATLEAMARAIFRDWFVDFGPTRAKMEGREPYLAPEIWSLFPDRLDDEGKPEGWEMSEIGKEATAVGGSTPSTKEPAYWGGNINWATPKDLSSLKAPVLLETSRTITEAGLEKISSGLLPEGTVLLSSRAPIGYVAIAAVPVAVNQGFIALKCEGRLSKEFVWQWLHAFMDEIKGNANGSTFQEISKKNFRPLPVVVPSEPARSAFDAIVSPMLERIIANERESRTLAQTRDLLLPRLMSGELRVAEAEKIVEEAL